MSPASGSRPKPDTYLAEVEPGDETGTYYITVCNLPFGTTWQAFKDWARTACEVDHVTVFPSSTSGWVRVLTRENFDRAWALLNGGNFNGRSIIASDKNATHSIKIRELVAEPSASRSKHSSRHSHSSPTSQPLACNPQSESAPGFQQGYYPDSQIQGHGSSRSPVAVYQHPNSASRRQQYGYYADGYPQASMGFSYPAPSVTGHAPSHGRTAPHASEGYAQVGYGGYYPDEVTYNPNACASVQYSAAYAGHGATPSSGDYYDEDGRPVYVETEARKILVTNIERKVKGSEVASWLRRRVGDYATQIVDIDVPRNEARRELRGHAFVIFQSARAAAKAIERLDGRPYHKRELAARLTSEGVARGRDDEHTARGAAEYSGPVIAHGSSKRKSDKRK